MTHQEKLDVILRFLAAKQSPVINEDYKDKLTFPIICRASLEVTEPWEVKFLHNILVNDGYITADEIPEITHNGTKFMQVGGYKAQHRNLQLDIQIKEKMLQKFQHDKWIFIATLIGVAISTATFVLTVVRIP